MKKLATYTALLVTLLAVTACENKDNRGPGTNNPPTRDRTVPQNPNQPPPPADQR